MSSYNLISMEINMLDNGIRLGGTSFLLGSLEKIATPRISRRTHVEIMTYISEHIILWHFFNTWVQVVNSDNAGKAQTMNGLVKLQWVLKNMKQTILLQ